MLNSLILDFNRIKPSRQTSLIDEVKEVNSRLEAVVLNEKLEGMRKKLPVLKEFLNGFGSIICPPQVRCLLLASSFSSIYSLMLLVFYLCNLTPVIVIIVHTPTRVRIRQVLTRI